MTGGAKILNVPQVELGGSSERPDVNVCGGVNETVSCSLRHLNLWSQVGGVVWGRLRKCAAGGRDFENQRPSSCFLLMAQALSPELSALATTSAA